MKRNLLITAGIILAAGAAFAASGYGPGYGMGAGMGGGYGMMGGQGRGAGYGCPGYGVNGKGAVQQGDVKPITKEDAQKKVDAYIATNLKGYKVEKVQDFDGMRGTMYNFFVKDASGNKFVLRMNPWGYIMGPFVINQ